MKTLLHIYVTPDNSVSAYIPCNKTDINQLGDILDQTLSDLKTAEHPLYYMLMWVASKHMCADMYGWDKLNENE